ncbi:MAG: hypothetical protein H6700_08280, partial [Myxococcales bacterium]|nr:hypothetical protein [Myxococcales bacterium]
ETVADGSVGAWFATVQSQIGSVYPIARFGSGGEVFLGGQDAQWRFTALEPDEEFEWMPFQVRVEAEAGARVRIPALGVDCNSTCDFLAPPGVTVPLHLEVPAGSVGTYFTGYVEPLLDDAGGDEWAFVAARDRVPNTVTRELIVRGTARDLAVVAGPVPTGDVTGSLVDFDYRSGSWLVATSQQAVSLDAAFAATASAPVSGLEGIAWANPTALGVPEGAVAVAVATLSPGGRSVVWLGPTLEVTASRPIQPFSSTAVTDGGVWELSPGVGGAMALSWHDADGTTSVAQTELADGVVFGDAATAYVLSRGESPSPRALRRYDRDGTLRWELGVRRSGGTTDAVWSIGDDRLYGLFDRENALVAAGTEYPTAGGLSHAVAELDAATGQVVRARDVGAVSIGRIAGGDDGVSVIGASTTSLELTMIGWDATTSVSRSVYDATVVPGHCTDPAVRCTPLPADVMRVSPDELAAAWVFQRPFELDGTSLDAEVPSIAVGVFRPR